jgi:hypothetical protein
MDPEGTEFLREVVAFILRCETERIHIILGSTLTMNSAPYICIEQSFTIDYNAWSRYMLNLERLCTLLEKRNVLYYRDNHRIYLKKDTNFIVLAGLLRMDA